MGMTLEELKVHNILAKRAKKQAVTTAEDNKIKSVPKKEPVKAQAPMAPIKEDEKVEKKHEEKASAIIQAPKPAQKNPQGDQHGKKPANRAYMVVEDIEKANKKEDELEF